MSFLDERGLPLDDAGVTIDAMRSEESHLLESVTVKIKVPEGFIVKDVLFTSILDNLAYLLSI